MQNNLFNAVQQLKTSTEETLLYGSLGLPIGGNREVEVPNRSGFVYVRLRDNTSEVIQAQNNTVSPVYDLPVILIRQGNRYSIKGRDVERYSDWGSYSSFVPRHAEQHSMDPTSGGGGDVVFVYGNQFMPLLTMPSGSYGAGGVILDSYNYQNGVLGWKYLGNTGTPSLLGYKPTGSSAVMVLVYLDTVSGNPGFIVGSGSYFSNGITGTAQVSPYIPAVPDSNWIPSAAIRLVSGTSSIGWDNIYDAKQYYAIPSTGSSGAVNIFTPGRVMVSDSVTGILKASDNLYYENSFGTGQMYHGSNAIGVAGNYLQVIEVEGTSSHRIGIVMSDTLTHSNRFSGFRGGGTLASFTPTLSGMVMDELRAFGVEDTNTLVSNAAGAVQIIGAGTWSPTSHPTKISLYTTAPSTTTLLLGTDIEAVGTATKLTQYGNIIADGQSDVIQLIVQGHSTQTANLQEWQNSGGTVIGRVTATTSGGAAGSLKLGYNAGSSIATGSVLDINNQYGSSATNVVTQIKGTNYAFNVNTSGSMYALYVQALAYATSGYTQSGVTYGSYYQAATVSSQPGDVNSIFAFNALGEHYSPGTLTTVYGVAGSLVMRSGCGNIVTSATALTASFLNQSSSIAPLVYGLNISITNTGSGSNTLAYGIYIGSIGATTNYAIYTNAGLNRLGDQLSIVGSADRDQLKVTGHTTQTNPLAYLIDNTSATNAVRNILKLETQSTGTAANGLGGGLIFSIETATASTMQNAGLITASWIDATNATRKAKLSLSAYDTAVRLGMEIEASGTAPMISFYGGTTVVRGGALTAQLTTITHTAPGTPDYALQNLTLTGYGFVTQDEGNTLLSVVANLQTRVAQLEARLGSATGVNLFA